MPDLPSLLANPIRWMDAATNPDVEDFLQDLQANILKSHGRHHTAQIFLGFNGMTPQDVAGLVRQLGRLCTSAAAQLRTNRRYPPYVDGGRVYCLFLSASGYKALGDHAKIPDGDAFRTGMAERQTQLNDPPRAQWAEVGWRHAAPDAMFLIADADPDKVTSDLMEVEGWLNGTGARIIVIERGLQQTRHFRSGNGVETVEHFGYVDGRSQPLFLEEDLEREEEALQNEPANPGNGPKWSPRFPPSQFIVRDPNGRRPLSAGSYFVFRKLEQNVRGFNKAEDDLGHALFGPGATQDQLDQAGAMVVGRFEDGTPLTLDNAEKKQAVPNGFTYEHDPSAARCPFHAHIRKTNPRGDIVRKFGAPEDAERAPIMARRGITYGAQRPMNADQSEFTDGGNEPVHDSGLLFMAYMASIEAQFEFTQQSWANNAGFVVGGNGVDPVIGQTTNGTERTHTYLDGFTPGAQPKQLSFDSFVHMQGGEYFFAPSLSFLRGVGL
jgi:Dyp-type peroxidase family